MRGGIFLFLLGMILVGVLWHPPLGSSSPERSGPFPEVRDREGRVLLRTERRFRLYYLEKSPLPPALRRLASPEELRGAPPYLLAEGLSPRQAASYRRVSGVLLEEYRVPYFTGGRPFEILLQPLLRRGILFRTSLLRLTLAWEVQERLYRSLRRFDSSGGRVGAAVIDLATGEVYGLVGLPVSAPNPLLQELYPLKGDLTREGVFGLKTGIELPESPGIYWPSGQILATPLQVVRALSRRLCGWAPEIHLIKHPPRALCAFRGKIESGEYIYKNKRSWFYLRLWPEKKPRFALLLAGEGVRLRPAPVVRGWTEVLWRWLPEGPRAPGKGFPDLRGLTLRAALERLPRQKLTVEFQGVGRVIRQWPRPGTPWNKVKGCKLYLGDAT